MHRADRPSSTIAAFSPLQALRRAPLFEGLDDDALEQVLAAAALQSFEPQDELCRAGEPAGRMWLIVNGLVHEVGDEAAVLARRRRGETIGAAALLAGEAYPATVVATIPTLALSFDGPALAAIAGRHPAVTANALGEVTRRLASANARRADPVDHPLGEAVALFVGESLATSVTDVVAATRRASPGSVELVDARVRADTALAALDDLLPRHRTVLVAAELRDPMLPLLLDQVDRAVAIVSDDAEARTVAALASEPAIERHPVEVVMMGASDASRPRGLTHVQGAIPVTRLVIGERAAGNALPPHDLAWLGRHLSRTKLGLALGAGGARGYAHVGVLGVLEEAGYTVDYVSGASIGAIVGALVALGLKAGDIEAMLRSGFDPDAVEEMFKLALSGGSTGLETITRVLGDMTAGRSFDDVEIPLTVMSVDLDAQSAAPLRAGPLVEALLAATALAGMFPPYELGGRRLVDGLALVPVPTGSVIEDGADVTVSVNLMSRDTLPAWPGEEPLPAPEARRRGSRMLDTLLAVMDLAQLDNSVRHAALADVPLTPRFGPNSWRDFHLADQFLAAGREAANSGLPELRRLAQPQLAAP
jgi:NTE family protein